jgi:sugar phosphate isomerase/epimerase
MKLGFVTAILPELRLEQVLEFAADEGFDCVEVMCWPVGKAEKISERPVFESLLPKEVI